jgi:hypothetical protein
MMSAVSASRDHPRWNLDPLDGPSLRAQGRAHAGPRDAPSSVGYLLEVSDESEPCAIPQCPQQAVAMLRLVVDGYDSVLPMCHSHADWFGAYVEEDADVRLVDRLPEATQDPVAEDGANDPV